MISAPINLDPEKGNSSNLINLDREKEAIILYKKKIFKDSISL